MASSNAPRTPFLNKCASVKHEYKHALLASALQAKEMSLHALRQKRRRRGLAESYHFCRISDASAERARCFFRGFVFAAHVSHVGKPIWLYTRNPTMSSMPASQSPFCYLPDRLPNLTLLSKTNRRKTASGVRTSLTTSLSHDHEELTALRYLSFTGKKYY